MPLWSCLGLFFFFFFFYAATPTPKRRCQSFSSRLSFSSSSFSQFAVFNHRRTNTISLPRWYLPTRRRACLKKKTQARQKRQRSAWRVVITFSALISRRRERGRSVGLQLLLPSLDSSLRICSLLYSLPPSFFFFFFPDFVYPPFSFSLSSPPSSLPPFPYLFNIFGNFYPGLSHHSCSTSLITFLFLTGLVGGTWGSDPSY